MATVGMRSGGRDGFFRWGNRQHGRLGFEKPKQTFASKSLSVIKRERLENF